MASLETSEVITEPPTDDEPQVIGPPAKRTLRGGVPLRMRITQPMRDLVRDMAFWGVPQSQMCRHFINPDTGQPIGLPTLVHYFRKELDAGAAEANNRLTQTAMHLALGHPAEFDDKGNCLREEQKPDRKMLIFQMRVRLKYSDRLVVEHKQAEEDNFSNVVKDLTPDELWQLRALLAKPVQGTDGGPPAQDGESAGGEES